MNFEANQYVEEYNLKFVATGKDMSDVGNEINRDQYKKGNTLFGFLVEPLGATALEFAVVRRGHTRLELYLSLSIYYSILLSLVF